MEGRKDESLPRVIILIYLPLHLFTCLRLGRDEPEFTKTVLCLIELCTPFEYVVPRIDLDTLIRWCFPIMIEMRGSLQSKLTLEIYDGTLGLSGYTCEYTCGGRGHSAAHAAILSGRLSNCQRQAVLRRVLAETCNELMAGEASSHQ